MNHKTCFFIGHRDAPNIIRDELEKAIETHIVLHGVTSFVVGHYGNYDRMAAQAVISAKQHYPNITLTMLLPYHPAENPISTPDGFDSTFYPPNMENVPKRLAIVRANRYMVDYSDYLIAYAWHPASNARELVEYTKRKGTICVTEIIHEKRLNVKLP